MSLRRALLLGSAAPPVTLNPSDKSVNITLSGGNLTATTTADNYSCARATKSFTTELIYFRAVMTTIVDSDYYGIGVGDEYFDVEDTYPGLFTISDEGVTFVPYPWYYAGPSGNYTLGGSAFSDGAIMEVCINGTTRKAWAKKSTDGSWGPSGDPAAGTGGVDISYITGALFPFFFAYYSGSVITMDFTGGTPPSGFSHLTA